jgi:hypothetical protein
MLRDATKRKLPEGVPFPGAFRLPDEAATNGSGADQADAAPAEEMPADAAVQEAAPQEAAAPEAAADERHPGAAAKRPERGISDEARRDRP